MYNFLRFSCVAAYLNRKDYNVFTVDWEPLTFFPCYLSSLSNTRLVAQCTAQFYAHLTYSGASAYDIHCVGHSLGAHICGMISNHLTHRQHKIIGAYNTYIYNITWYHRIRRVFIIISGVSGGRGQEGYTPPSDVFLKNCDNVKKKKNTELFCLYILYINILRYGRVKVLDWTWVLDKIIILYYKYLIKVYT